jgi:hypothetical protein
MGVAGTPTQWTGCSCISFGLDCDIDGLHLLAERNEVSQSSGGP